MAKTTGRYPKNSRYEELRRLLEPEIFQRAVYNTKKQHGQQLARRLLSAPAHTAEDLITVPFSWYNSPEGEDFWLEVYKQIKSCLS